MLNLAHSQKTKKTNKHSFSFVRAGLDFQHRFQWLFLSLCKQRREKKIPNRNSLNRRLWLCDVHQTNINWTHCAVCLHSVYFLRKEKFPLVMYSNHKFTLNLALSREFCALIVGWMEWFCCSFQWVFQLTNQEIWPAFYKLDDKFACISWFMVSILCSRQSEFNAVSVCVCVYIYKFNGLILSTLQSVWAMEKTQILHRPNKKCMSDIKFICITHFGPKNMEQWAKQKKIYWKLIMRWKRIMYTWCTTRLPCWFVYICSRHSVTVDDSNSSPVIKFSSKNRPTVIAMGFQIMCSEK